MQNKGLIKLFAILFGLVSLYQLSFTFFTNNVESKAKAYAQENVKDNNGRELAAFNTISHFIYRHKSKIIAPIGLYCGSRPY